ncbi:hypothetical protein ACSHXN_46910 (plasmid) [Streptomyces sp. HUAS TT11]|uniref:hypothetical protein n=1 Tax=Streptomyces sp. HUAS TT11 TaxID=3447508 RepID=UPI003F659263
MNIEEFQDLWEPGFDGNVLVRIGGVDSNDFAIFDPRDKSMLLIDDDDLHDEVVRRMLAAGAPVLDSFPRDKPAK